MRSNGIWIPPQAAGVPTEVTPVTAAELASLKGSGGLTANTIYEVPTSEATGGVVFVYATSANTVSFEADYYDPAISNQTLPIHYDCPSDRIDRMYHPERDNEVIGSAQVNAFPWASTSITETLIDQASFTYTGGTIRGLKAGQDSTVNISGGDVVEVTIGEDSQFTQQSGRTRYTRVDSRARITNNGTNIDQASFSTDAVATFTGGSFTNSSMTTGARLTQSNGAILETSLSENSLTRLSGPGRIYYSNVRSNGLLYADNWSGNFYYNDVSGVAKVELDGSAGNVQRNTFDTNVQFFWRNGTANFYYNTASDNATVDFDNSAGISVRYNSWDSFGFTRIENATAGSFLYNKISSRGYFLSTTGYTGAVTYLTLHSNGQVNNANGFSGSITQTEVTSRARLYATDFEGRIIYSTFKDFSYVYLERSAMDIYGVSVNNSYFFVRDAVAGSRVRDLTLNSYARFYGQFMGATGYVLRCTVQSYGLIYARNGFAATIRYCNVSSNAYFLVDNMLGLLQRSEAHSYARVNVTQPSGTSSGNNYTTNAYTIAAAISNDVQGY